MNSGKRFFRLLLVGYFLPACRSHFRDRLFYKLPSVLEKNQFHGCGVKCLIKLWFTTIENNSLSSQTHIRVIYVIHRWRALKFPLARSRGCCRVAIFVYFPIKPFSGCACAYPIRAENDQCRNAVVPNEARCTRSWKLFGLVCFHTYRLNIGTCL